MHAQSTAFANIALVKYWGKRDIPLNLPATGSLSLTLAPLRTETEVRFEPDLTADTLELDGSLASPRATARVSAFVDLFRQRAGIDTHAHVRSHNHFPTAAGLASSASAFAALAVAVDAALDTGLSTPTLSALARQGSGSAARSLYGGFAEMLPGQREDGTDAYAVPLHDAEHWPLHVVIALADKGKKEIGSTEGMEHTRLTSPYHQPWIDSVEPDLRDARAAIEARDIEVLAQVAERSAMRMHASAMAADPAILYWKPTTLAVVRAVRTWRAAGLGAFFSIDAGPNVKVFCEADDVETVRTRIEELPGVRGTITCRAGGPAHVTPTETPT